MFEVTKFWNILQLDSGVKFPFLNISVGAKKKRKAWVSHNFNCFALLTSRYIHDSVKKMHFYLFIEGQAAPVPLFFMDQVPNVLLSLLV